MTDSYRTGSVTLVGGGPGDPDLLTVAAVRALAAADVVLYDRLAPHETLAELAPGAELIDVRTPEEFDAGHLRGAENIDLSAPDFNERIGALDKAGSYVVYCASGNRAGTAIQIMLDQGFDDLTNGGGYEDLAASGLPTD